MNRRKTVRGIAGAIVMVLLCIAPVLSQVPWPQRPKKPGLERPEWTGVLMMHVLPGADVGIGSRAAWLKRRIGEFERLHPGVYIEMRMMTASQNELYYSSRFEGAPLADLVAFSSGMLQEPRILTDIAGPAAPQAEADGPDQQQEAPAAVIPQLEASGAAGGALVAAPYLRGGYVVLINKSAWGTAGLDVQMKDWSAKEAQEIFSRLAEVKVPGGRSGRTMIPLVASDEAYNAGAVALAVKLSGEAAISGAQVMSQADAWSSFSSQQSAAIVASQYTLYRMRTMSDAGRGFETLVLPLPGQGENFTDQMHYMGITARPQGQAREMCEAFVEYLRSPQAQARCTDVGMLPVIPSDENLYSDHPHMAALQKSADSGELYAPGALLWASKRGQAASLAQASIRGDASATAALRAHLLLP
ncbi:MAG: hypothetical protein ACOX88_04870 [Christensenellales bacterium]|jgi:ABC-type glycerol-3-phosphate transport system substrate-binding protein